jgi:pimeloyl-ACP methyl ester carboxylesterase
MGADLIEPTQVLSSLPHEASRVEVVPGTGHFLHLERPTEVNRLILDHVTAE